MGSVQKKEELLVKLNLPKESDVPTLAGTNAIRKILQEPIPTIDDSEIMSFLQDEMVVDKIPTTTCAPCKTVLQLHVKGAMTNLVTYVDPGSSANFIKRDIVDQLGLKMHPASKRFQGAIEEITGIVTLPIRPPHATHDVIVFAYVPRVWKSMFGDFLLGIPGARDLQLTLSYPSKTRTSLYYGGHQIKETVEKGQVKSVKMSLKEMIAAISIPEPKISSGETVFSSREDWIKKLAHIPDENTKRRYLELMVKHRKQFWKSGYLPAMKNAEYRIDYRGAPFREPVIPLPYDQKVEINRQCDIEASQGRLVEITKDTHLLNYVSNAFLKHEADKSRMCINYVTLNDGTVKTNMPIPNKEYLISSTSGADWYHSTDAKSAYNQMVIAVGSRKYLVFVIPGLDGRNRYFAPVRANFGTSNMPGEYSRVSGDLFSSDSTSVYLDDITVIGKAADPEQAYKSWKIVLETAAEHNILFSLKKTHLFQQEVKFLGEILDRDGHRPNPERVKTLKEWPLPKTKKQLQAFLGLYNFLAPSKRRAVSKVVQELQRYTHQDIPRLLPKEKINKPFQELKLELCTWLLLAPYEPNRRTYVMTDSSDIGLGGVVFQSTPNGLLAIAVCSKGWPKRKRAYAPHEKEGMAIVYTLKRFEPMLRLSKLVILTDSSNAVDLLAGSSRHKVPSIWLRWKRYITRVYDAEIIHVEGTVNLASDILSRHVHEVASTVEMAESPLRKQIRLAQQTDEFTTTTRKHLQQRQIAVTKDKPYFIVLEELLYRRHPTFGDQLVVPDKLQRHILNLEHDPELKGHPGTSIMVQTVSKQYYWKNMHKDIEQYVRTCLQCQLAKAKRSKKYSTGATRQCSNIFEIFSMDLIDMGTFSVQFQYILCVMDYYSGFVVLIPLRSKTAKNVLRGLWDVFTIFGPPHHLLSDRGTEFLNALVEKFTKSSGIQHVVTYAYHAQGNSKNERSHASVVQCLRIYAAEHRSQWVQHVKAIQYMLNTRPSAVSGLSSYEILFGVPPRPLHHVSPFEEFDPNKMKLLRARVAQIVSDTQNTLKNLPSSARPTKFSVGQRVLVVRDFPKRPKQLYPALGPFHITGLIGTTGYHLQHCDDSSYVLEAPSKWLRPFYSREKEGGGESVSKPQSINQGSQLGNQEESGNKETDDVDNNVEDVDDISDREDSDVDAEVDDDMNPVNNFKLNDDSKGGLRSGTPLINKRLRSRQKELVVGDMVLIDQGRLLRLAEVINLIDNEVIVHWFGTQTNKTLPRERWKYLPGWIDTLTGRVTYAERKSGMYHQTKTYLGGPSTSQLNRKEIIEIFTSLTKHGTIPKYVVKKYEDKRLH